MATGFLVPLSNAVRSQLPVIWRSLGGKLNSVFGRLGSRGAAVTAVGNVKKAGIHVNSLSDISAKLPKLSGENIMKVLNGVSLAYIGKEIFLGDGSVSSDATTLEKELYGDTLLTDLCVSLIDSVSSFIDPNTALNEFDPNDGSKEATASDIAAYADNIDKAYLVRTQLDTINTQAIVAELNKKRDAVIKVSRILGISESRVVELCTAIKSIDDSFDFKVR